MKCDIHEKDKAEILKKSIHEGKTIKELRKELKSAVSSYQKFKDFTEVKVRNFMKGFWHGKAEAQACNPDYTLDFDSFALPEVVVETMAKARPQDTQGLEGIDPRASGWGTIDQEKGEDKKSNIDEKSKESDPWEYQYIVYYCPIIFVLMSCSSCFGIMCQLLFS